MPLRAPQEDVRELEMAEKVTSIPVIEPLVRDTPGNETLARGTPGNATQGQGDYKSYLDKLVSVVHL